MNFNEDDRMAPQYTPKYIIDTSAWIEYFKGSQKGERVRDKIELAENYTPSVVLAEISGWFTFHKANNLREFLEYIKTKSKILEVIKEDIATRAGQIQGNDKLIKKEQVGNNNPMSYIDAIILALAENMEMKVVTLDRHFESHEYSEYIGQWSRT